MTDVIAEINGENYIVPAKINKKRHTHRNPQNWVSLWFYKDRKKTRVLEPLDVVSDKVITSKLEYQKDIFYKMSQMSEEDEFFDYYFKLKHVIKDKNIVKKNNRYKKGNPRNKYNKNSNKWREYNTTPLLRDASGRVILIFR